ncbi:hypothetical protein [Streptosporangium sp. NPDC051022]|uniref:hypothetical protein n=1 Tax=Streptosporangium sp. NPDC051022 TaxID=3155752 RepID=UPI003430C8B1
MPRTTHDRVFRVWRTLSFTAAPPGWRLIYIVPDEPDGILAVPMPGWVTQEACLLNPVTDTMTRAPIPETRVVAASTHDNGEIEEACLTDNLWLALPPDADLPTADAIQEAAAEYRQAAERRRTTAEQHRPAEQETAR